MTRGRPAGAASRFFSIPPAAAGVKLVGRPARRCRNHSAPAGPPGRPTRRSTTEGPVMLRKFALPVLLLLVCFGLSWAEEIRATITKVDGGKVTYYKNKGKGEKGDEATMAVADKVKVVNGKFNKET